MTNLQRFIFVIITIYGITTTQAASLSTIETKISEYISQHQAEQLAILEQLVNINSGTSNIPGVQRVGEILRVQFEQLGFTTRWAPEPTKLNRAATLIAEHTGGTGKKILLIGHLDTVFTPHNSFQKFKRTQNIATGPGIIDDKGGDVIILYVMKALHTAGALNNANITIVLTGDEEDSGKPTSVARLPLLKIAKNVDVALDFEWAITANTATIARRGITNWLITAQGREAHSAAIFQTASYGAIFEITRILNVMLTQLAHEKYLSFSPGLILGGTTINYNIQNSQGTAFGKTNVIAKLATVKGDLRFLTLEQKLNAEKKIIAIVNQRLPGTTSKIKFQDGIPAMPPTHNNSQLLQFYSKASADLGYGSIKPLDPGSRGAGDISHVASIVPANLAGLGALGTGAHSNQESLQINSLPIQTQRAALLIYRLSK